MRTRAAVPPLISTVNLHQDVHLVHTLKKWLTSSAWGFTEVQLRVRASYSRGHDIAKRAGFHSTAENAHPYPSGPGDDDRQNRQVWFANDPALFTGENGRLAPGRPGCKAHSECTGGQGNRAGGADDHFCAVEHEAYRNECRPCHECHEDEQAVDYKCPETEPCKGMWMDGRARREQELGREDDSSRDNTHQKCSAHEECGDERFCDNHNYCMPCAECHYNHDASNGVCPETCGGHSAVRCERAARSVNPRTTNPQRLNDRQTQAAGRPTPLRGGQNKPGYTPGKKQLGLMWW